MGVFDVMKSDSEVCLITYISALIVIILGMCTNCVPFIVYQLQKPYTKSISINDTYCL